MEEIAPNTIIENELAFAIVQAAGMHPKLEEDGVLEIWVWEITTDPILVHADEWGKFALSSIVNAVTGVSFTLGRKDGIKYIQGEMKKTLGL